MSTMTAEPGTDHPDAFDLADRGGIRLHQVFLGLAVVALVAGAAVVGGSGTSTFSDPAAYVQAFYDNGDADGMFAALAPATYAGNEEAFRTGVAQVVQQPDASATHTGDVVVNGVPLAVVEMADTLVWCVDPDGQLYVRCLVGSATATVDVGETGLETGFVGADILGATTQFVIVVGADQGASLAGQIELTDADGEGFGTPTQAFYSAGGQTFPVQELADIELEPGVGLVLIWDLEGADGRARVLGQQLELRWGDGALPIAVNDATWFLS